jgi:hypothetical protein
MESDIPFKIIYNKNSGEVSIFFKDMLISQECSVNLVIGEDIVSSSTHCCADHRMKFIERTELDYTTEIEKCKEIIFEFELKLKEIQGNEINGSIGLHFQIFSKLEAIRVFAVLPDMNHLFDRVTGFIDFGNPTFDKCRYYSLLSFNDKSVDNVDGIYFASDHSDENCWINPFMSENANISPYHAIPFLSMLKNNLNIAFFAMNGDGQRSLFRFGKTYSEDKSMKCISGSYMKGFPSRMLPGCIIVVNNDVNQAFEIACSLSSVLMQRPFILRKNKKRPEWYDSLGYCTWNAFYQSVAPDFVEDTFKWMQENHFDRIKYMILDDGWQDTNVKKQLISLYPNSKFPNMKTFISHLKSSYGLRWFGAWIAFYGYWEGMDKESTRMKEFKRELFDGNYAIPSPLRTTGTSVWIRYYQNMKSWGIDFTKVDNQVGLYRALLDKYPLDFGAQANHHMVEGAAYQFGMDVLNCMAMIPESYFNWYNSNVARVSDDYYPFKKNLALRQMRQLAYNTVVFRNFCYPDFDMFYTFDEGISYPLALMHVVGGSPIYFADPPEESKLDLLMKLSYKNGKIPMADEPCWIPNKYFYTNVEQDSPVVIQNVETIDGVGAVTMLGIFNCAQNQKDIQATINLTDVGLDKSESYIMCCIKNENPPTFLKITGDYKFEQKLASLDGYLLLCIPFQTPLMPIGLDEIFNEIRGIDSFKRIDKADWSIKLQDTGIVRLWHEFNEEELNKIRIYDRGTYSEHFSRVYQKVQKSKVQKSNPNELEEGQFLIDGHYLIVKARSKEFDIEL